MRYHRPLVLYCSELRPLPDAGITISTDPTVFPPKYSAVCITPGSSRRWRIAGPAEVYFLNQLWWDLVQAVGESRDNKWLLSLLIRVFASGGLMNIKWVADAVRIATCALAFPMVMLSWYRQYDLALTALLKVLSLEAGTKE